MAGTNGSTITGVIALDQTAPSGPLGWQVKTVEEEIGALVAFCRQGLIRAADDELRRVLRQNLTKLSVIAGVAPQTQRHEPRQANVVKSDGNTTLSAEDGISPAHGNSHQTHLAEADAKSSPERTTTAGPNGHDSSQPLDALTKALAPTNDPSIQVGTGAGGNGHEPLPSEVAIIRTPTGGGEAYSGTVHLAVTVGESAIQALQFVDALCRHPSMRIQRLLGTAKGRLDIWLQLRQPIHLLEELSGMEGVSQVNRLPDDGPSDGGAQLVVLLKEPQAVHVS